MKRIKIGVLVGSLRKGSYSRMVAVHLKGHLPEHFDVQMMDLADLSMFNQDYDDEGRTPQAWTTFREQVTAMDGFLFVTPEYNRSMPAVLKNALDIASRPQVNLWSGKPAALVSQSPGGMGGMASSLQLRQTMAFLNLHLMQQPEAYLSGSAGFLDDQGNVTQERTQRFLASYAAAFAQWVEDHTSREELK